MALDATKLGRSRQLVEQFRIRRLVVRIALPTHQKVDLVKNDDDRVEVVAQNPVEPIELLVSRNPALRDADVEEGREKQAELGEKLEELRDKRSDLEDVITTSPRVNAR
jgi:hypothetical protein